MYITQQQSVKIKLFSSPSLLPSVERKYFIKYTLVDVSDPVYNANYVYMFPPHPLGAGIKMLIIEQCFT